MKDRPELPSAHLQLLRDAISRSPIYLAEVALAERLADWERTRVSVDVDAVVLAWIASHVSRRPRSSLS